MLKAVVIGLCLSAVLGGMEQNNEPPKAVVSIKRNNAPVCLGAVVAISSEGYPTSTPPEPPQPNRPQIPMGPRSTIRYDIITAAHCVSGKQNSGLTVQFQTRSDQISVNKVHVHPYYSPPSRDYDIAVITAKTTKTSFIDLIGSDSYSLVEPLPLSKTPHKGNVSAYSWNTEPKTEDGSVEERKSCKAKLSKNIAVSAKMICANIGNVNDGTPLIAEVPKGNQTEKQIVGIGSYYVKDNGALPKVFTNIANSEIYTFIEKHIF